MSTSIQPMPSHQAARQESGLLSGWFGSTVIRPSKGNEPGLTKDEYQSIGQAGRAVYQQLDAELVSAFERVHKTKDTQCITKGVAIASPIAGIGLGAAAGGIAVALGGAFWPAALITLVAVGVGALLAHLVASLQHSDAQKNLDSKVQEIDNFERAQRRTRPVNQARENVRPVLVEPHAPAGLAPWTPMIE